MPRHVLHVAPASAPCRAALLHHRLLEHAPEIDVNVIDLEANEQRSDAFIAINPLHCVPTLITPHGTLWESRAIMIYFAEFVATVDRETWSFYPRHLFARAQVNQLLDWDQGSFYRAVSNLVYPMIFRGERPTEETVGEVAHVCAFIDQHLLQDGRPFLLGPRPTIADISIAMGATMLDLVGHQVPDMPRLAAWRARMTELPGWTQVDVPFQQWKAALGAQPKGAEAQPG